MLMIWAWLVHAILLNSVGFTKEKNSKLPTPTPTPAVEKFLKIRSHKGDVFVVNRYGNKSKLKDSDQPGLHDEIITEYQAEAILYYGKELEIKLFSDSRMRIEQMYDKSDDNDIAQMKRFGLLYGTLLAFVAKTEEVDGPMIRFNAPLISVKPQGRFFYLATTVEVDKIGKQEVNLVAGLEEGVIARFDKNHQTVLANYGQGVRSTLEGMGVAARDAWSQNLNWVDLSAGMEQAVDLKQAMATVRPIRTTNWKVMMEDLRDSLEIYTRKTKDWAQQWWQEFDYAQKEKWAVEKMQRLKQFINPD